MKQAKHIALVLLLLFGCTARKNVALLSGHWWGFSKYGDYVEMHIKHNAYKYSTDFTKPTDWNAFEIKGDTLIQYAKFLFPDTIFISKAKFHYTDKGDLVLEYLTSNEDWILHKLEEDIENIENNPLLRYETIKRSKKRKWIDRRTDEERKRDSLERIIDFRF